MKTEALKLALEALEDAARHLHPAPKQNSAITAVKEALAQEKALKALHDENERLGLYKDAYAQPEQEPVAWKPDRSGKYLTVVYRDVIPGDEVGAIVDHPKCVIMSWSNAVHDVEQLKNTTPPQRTAAVGEDTRRAWVGLTDLENAKFVKTMERGNFLVAIYDIEKRLKEKNT